jgi:hypothetical protein
MNCNYTVTEILLFIGLIHALRQAEPASQVYSFITDSESEQYGSINPVFHVSQNMVRKQYLMDPRL